MFRHRSATFRTALLALAFLIGGAGPIGAKQLLEDIAGVREMHWRTGIQMLPSKGSITVPVNGKLLVGRDTIKLDELLGGADTDQEAFLRLAKYGSISYYYIHSGFVVDDDWQCVNADDLLASLVRNRPGLSSQEVILGWAKPPQFDRSTSTITFMLRVQSNYLGEYNVGNAFVFGRNGLEMLMANSRKKDADTTWTTLQRGLEAFHFARGFRYQDHVTDDRPSAGHIAAVFMAEAGAQDLVDTYADCRATPLPPVSRIFEHGEAQGPVGARLERPI